MDETTPVDDGFSTDSETAQGLPNAAQAPVPVPSSDSVSSASSEPVETAAVDERDDKGRFKQSKRDWQSRVDKLTWEREEARRELAALRQQQTVRTAPEPETPAYRPPTSPDGIRSKPVEDEIGTKYPTYADFAEDLADWKFESRMAEREQREHQQTVQREAAQTVQKYREAAQEYAKRSPGYADRIRSVDDIELPPVIADAILQSDKGAQVSDYLATHREEFAQLSQEWATVPVQAASVVRRYLETRAGAASPGSASVSRPSAPAPIRPVSGSAAVASAPSPEDMDFGPEYVRAMNAREREHRRVR